MVIDGLPRFYAENLLTGEGNPPDTRGTADLAARIESLDETDTQLPETAHSSIGSFNVCSALPLTVDCTGEPQGSPVPVSGLSILYSLPPCLKAGQAGSTKTGDLR